jgi:Transposase DDE domain
MIGLALDNVAVDGCITKAPCGGQLAGHSPVDRGKQGRKRSLATEARGIPLAAVPAPANRHDSPLLAPTLDAALATLSTLGPLPTDITVALDAAYNSDTTRATLADRDLQGQIAHKGTPPRSRPLTGGRWSTPSPGATSSASCAGSPNAPGRWWSFGSVWPTRSSRWVG